MLFFFLSNDSQAEQWEGEAAGVSVWCADLTAGFRIGLWAVFVMSSAIRLCLLRETAALIQPNAT